MNRPQCTHFLTSTIALFAILAPCASTLAQEAGPTANPGYAGMTVDAEDFDGLRVVEVERGGPADKGGVRVGDLLLAIGGKPLNEIQDLIAILRTSKVGAKLDLVVARAGRRLQVRVTLAKRSPQARSPLLGLRTLAVTPELREQYKLPMSRGAFVTAVTKESPADEAHVPAHVLIVKINGHSVASPSELLRWVKAAGPGEYVELIYYDQGRLRKTAVKLADSGDTRGIIAKPTQPTAPPARRPVRPKTPSLPTSDRQRIRLLEQRIEQLEKRVETLEKRHAETQ